MPTPTFKGSIASSRARFAALMLVLAAQALVASPAPAQSVERGLPTHVGRYTGDLDAMLEHHLLRVLVPYSRTLFFFDRGTQRGSIPEAMRELEKRLNRKFKGERPFTIALIPTTRDKLFSGLNQGIGDMAAGNITITPARANLVDFTAPTIPSVAELIVTGPKAPPLTTLDDLAGKEVHVRASTSYYESLIALNTRFEREGKPAVIIRMLPDALEDEDKLEMVNAGLVQISVVDDWLGKIWAPMLPKLALREDLVLRGGGQVAWAIRKQSPQLLAVLNEAIAEAQKRGGPGVFLRRAAADAKRLYNATSKKELEKFHRTLALFEKYGKQYEFDHLMLAAQGYQESRLDQSARSPSGAVGVMQLMPATGKELQVGDIRQLEPNIHGGARYMSRLMDRYFKDANFDETNRTLFAFASYNAGPRNIAKVRKAAKAEGLDENVWFNSVEYVAAKKIGREPVQYVRNIYKYYVAYKLAQELEDERSKAVRAAHEAAD